MTAGLEAGLGLMILALVFIMPVLVIGYLRRMQRNTSVVSQIDASFSPPNSSQTNEAVLIVQSGGRVEYVNALTR